MKRPTSIRMSAPAQKALEWLRAQPGGFNLNLTANQVILAEAKKRGWKEEK